MELARLKEVDVRTAWEHEAHDFTPWLLDHDDHLAETLGIDLELEQSEHPVGGFSLDLIGTDLTNDTVLIVENQLDSTDHSHLGQIMTYTAGTDASTVVWIATSFRDEHRQALDWLNEHTREDIRFFGIELAVVRIADSPPAPLFRLVAEPNDWQKQIRSATGPGRAGSRTALYRAFWAKYLESMRSTHPDWSRARKPSDQNWMSFPSPIRGTGINPSFAAGKRLRHELYVDTGDGESTETVFNDLLSQRVAFESAYGKELEWDPLPGKRASRIADYRSDAEVNDEDCWDDFVAWMIDAGVKMRRALGAIDLPGD